MKTLIGQHMLIGISGHSLTTEEKKFILENDISGVVLFSRNVSGPKQVHELCSEIQSLRHHSASKAPLFIGIDMEGGRVARLKKPFTEWPPLKLLGDLDSPTVSFHFAHKMGLELKSVGINLDFAPCVDVFTNPKNTVIGDRSLSADPELVAKHASALIRGYLKAEIIPCAKHFPGHGNTLLDSHFDLPVEEVDADRLENVELVPFKKACRSRIPMIMTAHITFSKIDPDWPVTLSEIFLKSYLRDKLKYKELIITDDLDMKALASHYDQGEIPLRALEAGADLLLYCNEPESPPLAIERISQALSSGRLKKSHLENTHKKILAMKAEHIKNPEPYPLDEALALIGSPEHFQLSQAIAKGEVPPGLIAVV